MWLPQSLLIVGTQGVFVERNMSKYVPECLAPELDSDTQTHLHYMHTYVHARSDIRAHLPLHTSIHGCTLTHARKQTHNAHTFTPDNPTHIHTLTCAHMSEHTCTPTLYYTCKRGDFAKSIWVWSDEGPEKPAIRRVKRRIVF